MALIPDLPSSNSMSGSDLLIKDTGSATQQITFSNFKQAIVGPCAVHTFSISSGHTATITFNSQISALLAASGWIQSGFSYLSYVSGYVSGTRSSNTVLANNTSYISVDLSSTSAQISVSNSSATGADFVVLDFRSSITSITVS